MGISNDVMPVKGSRIDGKHGIYELGDELGHGGNGTVFDVRIVDRKDDFLSERQETVIKILTISYIKSAYTGAVKPPVRRSGNRGSGMAGTAHYAA